MFALQQMVDTGPLTGVLENGLQAEIDYNKWLFLTWECLWKPLESLVKHCPVGPSEAHSTPGPGPLFPGKTEGRGSQRSKTDEKKGK